MQRKLILATVLTAMTLTGAGLATAAGDTTRERDPGITEVQMFQAAKVKLADAGAIALKEVPGTLAAIGFNDEDGKGVYEALVVGTDGQTSIVKIDADSGVVLGKGLARYFDDEGDREHHRDRDHDDGDGEHEHEG